jgi:hypothetical protein
MRPVSSLGDVRPTVAAKVGRSTFTGQRRTLTDTVLELDAGRGSTAAYESAAKVARAVLVYARPPDPAWPVILTVASWDSLTSTSAVTVRDRGS